MSLASVYERFLADPQAALLTDDCALHYVPTLKSFSSSGSVMKHFATQDKQIKRKVSRTLHQLESGNALCLEIETVLQFVSGGDAYLPGLDDNFLTDIEAALPIIHFVHFDNHDKIQQIRLFWDQASLLKQAEVIGSRGSRWPITDGKDQIKLIATSLEKGVHPEGTRTGRLETATRQMDDVTITSRGVSPSKKRIKDPHTSLTSWEIPEDPGRDPSCTASAIAPRALVRPAQRDLTDIFTDESSSNGAQGGHSAYTNLAKAGAAAAKNYQPSRLFDQEEGQVRPPSPKKQAHPNKYSHFEFGEVDDSTSKLSQVRPTRTNHQSQWNFSDFSTPAKPAAKPQREYARSAQWDENIVEDDGSPKPVIPKSRRDAETHFELKDDGEGVDPNRGAAHPRGPGTANRNANLYENNVWDENGRNEVGRAGEDATKPMAQVAPNAKDRHKDFDPHFDFEDSSPAGLSEKNASALNKPLDPNRARAVRMMNANWAPADTSPQPGGFYDKFSSGPEVVRYRSTGNGMGARKGTTSSWGHGDDDSEPYVHTGKENRAVKNHGDGMGGRKGGKGRGWAIGDESGDEEEQSSVRKNKIDSSVQPTEGAWDF